MTTFAVPTDQYKAVMAACQAAFGRLPVGPDASLLYTYTPDVDAAALATILSTAKSAVAITPAERTTIEPSLATLRTFQQLSQNDFIALTQNARDRQLFDTTTALIRVIRVLLRD